MSMTMTAPVEGPAVEQEIAHDILKHAVYGVPIILAVSGAIYGFDGVASSALAAALVLVNFVFAAALLAWAARISLGFVMAAALFGYVLRLALVTAVVLAVKDLGWVNLWALGLSLIVTHLGLLLWETRYVSATAAFPGLKPRETV